MRTLLLAGMALVSVSATQAPLAAPVLSYRVFQDDLLQTGAGLSGASGTGTLIANGATSNFSFVGVIAPGGAAALGSPTISEPAFQTQVSVASALSLAAPSTLRIEFTQTGVDSGGAGGAFASLASSIAHSFLVGGGVGVVSTSTYVSAADVAFGRDVLLASLTSDQNTGPANDAVRITSPAFDLPNRLFSETIVVSASFVGGGASLGASSQLQGVPVPEPASLALLGVGLLGLGLLHARRGS